MTHSMKAGSIVGRCALTERDAVAGRALRGLLTRGNGYGGEPLQCSAIQSVRANLWKTAPIS
jgi:hypothetical protein